MTEEAQPVIVQASQSQVVAAVRNILRGEVIPKNAAFASREDQKTARRTAIEWLRAEIAEVVKRELAGNQGNVIRNIIREQVSLSLDPFRRNRDKLAQVVEKMVREEVQAQVKACLKVEVTGTIGAHVEPEQATYKAEF